MKIIVSEIPEEGIELELSEDIRSESVKPAAPVQASLKIEKAASEVFIRGVVSGTIELQCSRCLKTFTMDIKSRIEVVYHPAESIGRDEHYELKSDELDMGFYKNDTLETGALLEEQLLLHVPMKPLCSPECKGICPQCGADLNMSQCNCDFSEVDPRLRVLEQLLKRKE